MSRTAFSRTIRLSSLFCRFHYQHKTKCSRIPAPYLVTSPPNILAQPWPSYSPPHNHIMALAPSKSFYRRKLPDTLAELKSSLGKKLFSSALAQGNAEAFFPLVSQFQTQSHPALCGLTTLSTILNALEIDPKRVWAHPWRWFAESLLDCCLDMDDVKTSGITMDELARTARCQGSVVHTIRGYDVEQARELIQKSVRGNKDGTFEFVVASYDRKTLGQTGSGHYSPIAAFDVDTDTVLVLDVARFKYGPHWVPLKTLVEATKPLDPNAGLSRGFLTFQKFDPGMDGKGFDERCESNKCKETADSCKHSTATI